MELLHIVRMLTAGVVGGQKDWHTTKVKSAPRYETLVSKMRDLHKDKRTGESSSHRVLDNGICDDAPERFRNKTWPSSKADKSDCSNSDTTALENSCEKATGDASAVRTGPDLNVPAEWQMYKYQLDKKGKEVADVHGWDKFERVFMISALSGDGVQDLRASV